MRPIVTLPYALMRAMTCDWDIDWSGQSAGQSTAATDQIVYNRFPRWIGSPQVHLAGDLIGLWRAARAVAQGRVGLFRVPMVDNLAPVDVTDTGIPFGTDEPFSSGLGFEFTPFVTCAAGAPAGASEFVVQDMGYPLRVGQFLSHDDWPFVVTSITAEGSGLRLTVQMPLRRAIPADGLISLRATGLFQATEDMTGNPSYDRHWRAKPQISFTEWISRP